MGCGYLQLAYRVLRILHHGSSQPNRFSGLSLGQLKILQEVISLGIFVPFAFLYMKQPLKLDYLWASLCMLGAAYFMFRDKL